MFLTIAGVILVSYVTGIVATRTFFRDYLAKNVVYRYKLDAHSKAIGLRDSEWDLQKVDLGANYVAKDETDARYIFFAATHKAKEFSWFWFLALPGFFIQRADEAKFNRLSASYSAAMLEKRRSEVLLEMFRLDDEDACADVVAATTFSELNKVQQDALSRQKEITWLRNQRGKLGYRDQQRLLELTKKTALT